jgi:hypothetical protein
VEKLIEEFTEIRQYVIGRISEMAEIYFTQIWDPIMKFIIIKETNQLIDKDLEITFPKFPKKYFPKVKFRLDDENHEIEAGIQTYLNDTPNLTFLGTNEIDGVIYDYYLRDSFDPSIDYMFYARYGHDKDSCFSGAKTAAAEYFIGHVTPLSVAFAMAVEDGYIE